MPVIPEFQPAGRASDIADNFDTGMNNYQSWMDRSQARRIREAEEARQQLHFQVLQPVLKAKADADMAQAQGTLDSAKNLQDMRAWASRNAIPAQQSFDNISKISDLKQRLEAGMQWVNQYGQFANIKEYEQQFNNNKELIARTFQDYQTHQHLQNALDVAKARGAIQSKTPYMKLMDAYENAKDVDPTTAALLKNQIDKQNSFFTPAQKNELNILGQMRANPPPGMDASVIDAKIEAITGRTLQSEAPAAGATYTGGAAPAPAATPEGGAPVAPAPAPVVPKLSAAGPRLTPGAKTTAQEHSTELEDLIAQGGKLVSSLKNHPEYLGVSGEAGSKLKDELLPALGMGTGNQGRVDARAQIGLFRDAVLKSVANLPRVSQSEINDIRKNLPDTGWTSNLPEDQTKLRRVIQILADKAKTESTALGTKSLATMTPEELREVVKKDPSQYDRVKSILLALHPEKFDANR